MDYNVPNSLDDIYGPGAEDSLDGYSNYVMNQAEQEYGCNCDNCCAAWLLEHEPPKEERFPNPKNHTNVELVGRWMDKWTETFNVPKPTDHEQFLLISFAGWLDQLDIIEKFEKE